MKKLYKYIVLVYGILAFSACTDEIEFPNVVEEGTDVTLRLNVKAQANNNVVVSRAAADEKLYDLHFYVFNEAGKLTGYEKLVSGNGEIASPNNGGEGNGFPINIRTKTGNSYVYAVANINKSINYTLDKADSLLLNVTQNATADMSDDDLKGAIATANAQFASTEETFLDKFLTISFNRNYGSENALISPNPESNFFIMSGYLHDGEMVAIPSSGNVGDNNIINLYRIVAKNTLKIKSTRYGEEDNYKYVFTPKYYRLCNVPKKGALIPGQHINSTRVDKIEDYVINNYLFNNDGEQINTSNITINDVESSYRANFPQSDQNGEYTITFYYPENLQVSKSGVSINQWEDRENNDWDYTSNAGVKEFLSADDKAAYIEIYGDYMNETGNKIANVSYTIHLGNFSGSNHQNSSVKAKSLSDFNVVRNYAYNYAVNVIDVRDIEVEATTGQDNPYAEGMVIVANPNRQLNVDAHYESRVLTFTKKDMIDLKSLQDENKNILNYGYFINIKTPFWSTPTTYNVRTNGIYIGSEDEPLCTIGNAENYFTSLLSEGKIPDFKWVKFVRNGDEKVLNSITGTEDNRIASGLGLNRYPCVYPGDNYKKYEYDSDGNITTTRNGGYLNVFELLAELYNTGDNNVYTENINSNNPNSGEVYYTCFIDENYYENKSWTEFVNKDPRVMLIANNLDVSSDRKSVYAEVKYSISQRSIATFYQTDYKRNNGSTLVTAFGTETVDEEDEYNTRLSNRSSDDVWGTINYANNSNRSWDARSSAVATNYVTGTGQNWYTSLHNNWQLISSDKPQPQPLYSTVAKACMSRNRDINGNGHIDENEIRWYLPAIGQYRALYIGQSSFIGNDAYLISEEELGDINDEFESNGNRWTGSGNDNGHSSRSIYHYYTSSDGNEKIFWPEEGLTNNPSQGGYSWAELVRCVRTLGGTDGKGLANPEKYYDDVTNRTFILGGVIETRGYTNVAQIEHNEIQAPNNLSGKFQVAQEDFSLTTAYQQEFQGYYHDYKIENNEFHIGDEAISLDIINGNAFYLEDITGLDPTILKNGDKTQIPNPEANGYEPKDFCSLYYESNTLNSEGKPTDLGTWRTPNQKEMALMLQEAATLGLSSVDYGTRSRFTGCDNGYGIWHNTAGIWASDDRRLNVGTGYEFTRDYWSNEITGGGVRIRCVRDVR